MAVDVRVPSVGESVKEGIVYKWHKKSGDSVRIDDVLVELETDKATVEVVAEAAGTIQIAKNVGEKVAIGDVLATIHETSGEAKETSKVAAPPPPKGDITSISSKGSTSPSAGAHENLSPAVRKLVAENQLQPSAITPSGKDGRLTKGDVVAHIESRETKAPVVREAPAVKEAPRPVSSPTSGGSRGERREPMSLLRRRIAERLLQAQQVAAILTTFNEVDMTAVMKLRLQYKEKFEKRHGVPLGFMTFFVKAALEALKAYPGLNGWIEGSEIVYHDYYDIGVAVSTERGLVVPVLRNAEKLNFAQTESAIMDFAKRARENKISVDDMTGGTFTVSNGGVFGSLLSTPILNPPQSGILGMHKIEDRAVVVQGEIVIRPMMYLALSYDHRIVDGREAVQFLVRVKDCIEDPTRLILGV